MKHRRLVTLACVVSLLTLGTGPGDAVRAETGAAESKAAESRSKSGAKPPTPKEPELASTAPEKTSLYKLPSVGKPRRRVGGGRRGTSSGVKEHFVLVPEHVGLTISTQPSLYWYLPELPGPTVSFEFTLIDDHSIEPLVDTRLPAPTASGLQRIDLATHGASLEAGQEYQWSVSLVTDPDRNWDDIVASGWIERVPAPAGLQRGLARASAPERALVYGQASLWYDLLDAVCDQLPAEGAQDAFAQLIAEVDLELPGTAAAAGAP